MRVKRVLTAIVCTMVFPAASFAQSEPLAQILPDLLLRSVTMSSSLAGVAGNPHEAHFIAALGQDATPFTINKLLVEQLGTLPIGSSSAGFVFTFDPATGLFAPASASFGPLFAERALTNGKGRFGLGFNYQHLVLQSYEGVNLDNGDLAFVLQHNDCCGTPAGGSFDDPPFEGDLVRISVSLNMKTDIFAPYVSYGLSNRWDIGAVVPILRVSLNPTMTSTIDRIATCPNDVCTGVNQFIHSWNGFGQTTKIESLGGSKTGIGDIVLRTKYRVVENGQGGVVAGIDVRLPTGDKANLLGTGAVQTKLLMIASGDYPHFSPHVNLGFTASHGELSPLLTTLPSSGQPANAATQSQINAATGAALADPHLPNEFNYVAGFDYAAHSLLTISADVVGRTFFDTQRFDMVTKQYLYRVVAGGPTFDTTRTTFDTTGSGALNTVLGAVGAKYNIPGTSLLVTGTVMFPVNHSGLNPKPTPIVGLDYSFK